MESKMRKTQKGLFDDTGVFSPETETPLYKIGLDNGAEIRYRTAYELGFIVGYGRFKLENPLDPATTEFDEFFEGQYRGREKAKEEGR